MKTQQLDKSTTIGQQIGKEMSTIRSESNQADEQSVHFSLSFCRFVEGFGCLQNSTLGCIAEILSTQCPFPDLCTLSLYFDPSFNPISHFTVNLNSIFKKEMIIGNIKSIYFVSRNDEIDYHPFFSPIFDEKKWKNSSALLIEMENIVGLRNVGNECCFVLQGTEVRKSEMFGSGQNEKEKETIISEMDEIRQLLKLSGGSNAQGMLRSPRTTSDSVLRIDDSVDMIESHDFKLCTSLTTVIFSSSNNSKIMQGFRECTSLCRIEIPSSVEMIGAGSFNGCRSLNEVVFSSESHLRNISGFCECTSLCRIEIPSSVEIIGSGGFNECRSLNEVVFSSDSHLRNISGFCECTSLCRIEIPSSVEIIRFFGFRGCRSLNAVIFSSDSHLREISGFQHCTSLCRIEIPSSVERIGSNGIIGGGGFHGCTSLNEIVFSSDSHLREIYRFRGCTSLCRIEIPSSVEMIASEGFHGCTSLRVVIISTRCRMKENAGFRNIKPFLVDEGDDVKACRRLVHLGALRR
jgi:hypothetical protein